MLDKKLLGYVQVGGGLLAGILLYVKQGLWSGYLLCLLFLLTGLHNLFK